MKDNLERITATIPDFPKGKQDANLHAMLCKLVLSELVQDGSKMVEGFTATAHPSNKMISDQNPLEVTGRSGGNTDFGPGNVNDVPSQVLSASFSRL